MTAFIARSQPDFILPAVGLNYVFQLPEKLRSRLRILYRTEKYTPYAMAALSMIPFETAKMITNAVLEIGSFKKKIMNLLGMKSFMLAKENVWDDVRNLHLTSKQTEIAERGEYKMSFRLKTVLGIAGIEIILLSILIVSSLHYLRVSNEQQLLERARTTAKLVATMTSDAVVAMDIDRIDVLINQTIKNPGIDFVRVRLANGTVVSESGNPSALRALFAQDSSIASANRDGRLDVRHPINVGGKEFGRIEIGFGIGALDLILRDARQWMLSLAGLEIVLVGIFGLIFGRILTRQLVELQKGAQR